MLLLQRWPSEAGDLYRKSQSRGTEESPCHTPIAFTQHMLDYGKPEQFVDKLQLLLDVKTAS